MPTAKQNNHLDFWKDFDNHAKTRSLLKKHGIMTETTEFDAMVFEVSRCWMKLAKSHISEAKSCHSQMNKRAFYSRAYYSVYNASKAVRYLVKGAVSDRGDDHQKISDLPPDFPDWEEWGRFLRNMYQFRLIADYDGWNGSTRKLSSDTANHLKKSKKFIFVAKDYLKTKFGEKI